MNWEAVREMRESDNDVMYIANDKVMNQVEWKQIGTSHGLVKKTNEDDKHENNDELVLLSAIGRVAPNQFFMASDGRWTHATDTAKTIDRVNLSLWLTPAYDIDGLVDDGKRASQNVWKLTEQVHKVGNTFQTVVKDEQKECIKIKHTLIRPTAEKTQDDENLEKEVGYTIKTWPTTSSAARSALDALASTHFVQPFPAYTSDGRLMPPEEYSTLRNALCEVQFTLSHWNMENLKKDVYAANVIAVNVIQAGKPVFAAPKRKKLALPKASQPSPAKRQRTDGGKKN